MQYSSNFILRSIWILLDANTVGRSLERERDKKCSLWNILNQKHSSCSAYPYNITRGFRVTVQFTAKLLLLQWVLYLRFHCLWQLANGDKWNFLSSLQDSAVACNLTQIPLQQERLKTDLSSFPGSYEHVVSLIPTKPLSFWEVISIRDICDAVPIGSPSISLTRFCLLVSTQWTLSNFSIYTECIQHEYLVNIWL